MPRVRPMILTTLKQIALLTLAALAFACGNSQSSDGPTAEQEFPKLLEKAKAGDAKAQLQVGGMLGSGNGCTRDITEAYMWYLAAKANGEEAAADPMIKMMVDGGEISPEQIKTATDKAAALSKKK